MARPVVTADLVEGRIKGEIAREYEGSRRWVITHVRQFLAEDEVVTGSSRTRSEWPWAP
jgi:hypothetical protein